VDNTANPADNPDSANPGQLPKLKIKLGNEPPMKIEGGGHTKSSSAAPQPAVSKMSRAMGTSVENETLFLATAKIPKKIK